MDHDDIIPAVRVVLRRPSSEDSRDETENQEERPRQRRRVSAGTGAGAGAGAGAGVGVGTDSDGEYDHGREPHAPVFVPPNERTGEEDPLETDDEEEEDRILAINRAANTRVQQQEGVPQSMDGRYLDGHIQEMSMNASYFDRDPRTAPENADSTEVKALRMALGVSLSRQTHPSAIQEPDSLTDSFSSMTLAELSMATHRREEPEHLETSNTELGTGWVDMASSLADVLKAKAVEQAKQKPFMSIMDYSTDPMRNVNVSSGDERLMRLNRYLDSFASIGYVRSSTQKLFHFWFTQAVLPQIYAKDWDSCATRVLKMHGLEKICFETMIMAPRR